MKNTAPHATTLESSERTLERGAPASRAKPHPKSWQLPAHVSPRRGGARANIVDTESAGFSVSSASLRYPHQPSLWVETPRVRCGSPRAAADLVLDAVSRRNAGISLVTIERARTPLE
ncbi:hypothetical protein SNOG_00018 [Parastagonospora nodorum SN15]|uniref:Uncharacterized protein n=1 Tax=Phaeosphaeria nodorum (strain SN15 / ATCC MYA-4574 / FGSC 10173) TaxID=321614 RepID=Q0V7J6_PHANO|nr:hypothetical protein SNOG_00018 [Parastagonospora nodorum SN15]EAT91513.1 hypothetical protein SNOG_00018 [Parastagonospora nodorum SN15]